MVTTLKYNSSSQLLLHFFKRLKLDENLKNLEISAKGETFREIFGVTQKRKDLHSNLSILNFREFDLDYRTNFMTIQTFIELHVSIIFYLFVCDTMCLPFYIIIL